MSLSSLPSVPTIVRQISNHSLFLRLTFVRLAVVGAIDEFATDFSISKAFIGVILLPIVGNAAEVGGII